MPVKKDPDGNRSVEAEAEVPGTPEEVWAAIASGQGISSWFVPTKVEEKEGGAVISNFGPGMDSSATIKVWDPPRRFVADSPEDIGPGGPSVATEWIVEARDGGTCIVRVVHRWFTSKDDWDDQFEGHTHGWRAFFRILRLYLLHFSGQACSAFQVMGSSSADTSAAWEALTRSLGLTDAAVGQHRSTIAGAPTLAGVVERVGPPEYPGEILLKLDQPAPGLAHLFALPMGGMVFLSTRVFLYGDQAAAAVAKHEPIWQAWVAEKFPMPGGAPPEC